MRKIVPCLLALALLIACAERDGRSSRPGSVTVGEIAPDIVGKDLDGVQFKLSDYRGKVVMLDFWGDW